MSTNANKQDVLKKLDESIRYCNSPRDDSQILFDQVVEAQISACVGLANSGKLISDMKALFPILLSPDTVGFIPSITMKQDTLHCPPHEYLSIWFAHWVAKFVKAWESLPSESVAKPKSAVTDRALMQMVLPHAGSREKAAEWVKCHNLLMSAENVGGSLLEEYIASKISQYGWIWCRGQVLTAVDFCNLDCTAFIQIKNKSNTENSSGKGFREDRKAPVWFRMYAERKNGKIVTRWPELIEIVRQGRRLIRGRFKIIC